MKLPLLLLDRGDISLFASRQDLQNYVESPDIAEYLVFDSEGHKFELESFSGRTSAIVDVNPVRLVEVDSLPQTNLLIQSIRVFLNKVGVHVPDDCDLTRLVQVLVEYIGYTK